MQAQAPRESQRLKRFSKTRRVRDEYTAFARENLARLCYCFCLITA